MATTFQMLLRGLDGRTSCLHFSSGTITGSLLQDQIADVLHIPAEALLIVSGTSVIRSQTSLFACGDGVFPSCSLLLRLRGGKGGFGSLLRGAATKAGQKKTSNFDACRDMSGRRLRHVNAEKKLKEWKAQAKERELEKAANAFLKKQVKRKEDESGCSKEIEKYREETSRAMEEVESAVARGLAEAKKFGKRKIVEEAMPITSSKRAHIWLTSEDDIIEEGSENENEVSEDENGEEGSEDGNAEEGSEDKNTGEGFEDGNAEEGSEDKTTEASEDVNAEEGSEDKNTEEGSKDGLTQNSIQMVERIEGDENHAITSIASVDNDSQEHHAKVCEEGSNGLAANTSLTCVDDMSSENGFQCRGNGAIPVSVATGDLSVQKQLNFDDFLHASEMEVLGLERLKHELQARGLKCSGSLAERAGRLFLLKTTSLEKLDRKHFAKTKV